MFKNLIHWLKLFNCVVRNKHNYLVYSDIFEHCEVCYSKIWITQFDARKNCFFKRKLVPIKKENQEEQNENM